MGANALPTELDEGCAFVAATGRGREIVERADDVGGVPDYRKDVLGAVCGGTVRGDSLVKVGKQFVASVDNAGCLGGCGPGGAQV